MNTKNNLHQLLQKATGGPVSIGKLIEAIRLGEEMTQLAFAKKLKISKSHLNDIEKGRKAVSPERAAKFAKTLKYSPERFISLALQGILDEAGLKYRIDLKVA